MFMPQHIKMLCLSATVPNINELSTWIESVHKTEFKKVQEVQRPVPLHFFFQCQNEVLDQLQTLRHKGYKQQIAYSYRGRQRFTHKFFKPNRLSALLHYLQDKGALPCIYFAFGRRRCEDLAVELYSFNFLTADEQKQIELMYNELCERFDLTQEKSAQRLLSLIKRGVAYHHAGMLPTLKEVIERLFTSRLLKVIFTTETFALGINMPARTVVFDEMRKFYGHYHRNLKTRDFYQMAGRAGRRGMDRQGFVYCRINPRRIEYEEIKRILYGRPESIYSKFNSSYATLLHLYAKYQEKLYDIYPLSLHYFQQKPRRRKGALAMLRSRISLLKELDYISNNELTAKGTFAAAIYGYELPLAEIYAQGILEKLNQVELGILTAALVYEPRKRDRAPKITRNVRHLKEATDRSTKTIHQLERRFHIFPNSKEYHYHLAQVTEAWLQGTAFSKLGQYSEVDEGELVRYFRMIMQILREIQHAPVFSDLLKDKVRKLLPIFNRDIVDAEKQLRLH